MNRQVSPERFPRGALIGAAALIAFSLLAAAVGRLTGATTVDLASAVPVQSVELRFMDAIDLSRPKDTPEVTAHALFMVPVGPIGQVTFASLTPIEASEILRDLAFLV